MHEGPSTYDAPPKEERYFDPIAQVDVVKRKCSISMHARWILVHLHPLAFQNLTF